MNLRRSTILADTRQRQRSAKPSALVRVGAGATGTDAENDLADATTVGDVDRVARKYLKNGDVPNYLKRDFWSYLKIEGNGHVLELRVAPDYFALGTNEDPLRLGKTSETFAQEAADSYGAHHARAPSLRPRATDAREIRRPSSTRQVHAQDVP